MDNFIAVFDIGKSNKKFLVFSENLEPIYSESIRIDEIKIDNLICDDAESMLSWMRAKLMDACKKWPIKALNITTFGATVANLKSGVLRLPVISYNQEVEKQIKEKFYAEFGSPLKLYMLTGTPPYGQLLNAGIQVFWIREKFPEIFNDVDEILFLPQYLTYALTGLKSSEVTSLGCHTYLYDITRRGWSSVAEELRVNVRSPKIFDVWSLIGEFKFESLNLLVTPGIHDSNACLLPYIARGGDFLLASTGTWCVFMCPMEDFRPKREDLYRDVLYYVDAYGRPVRSSRFKGGFEYDYYKTIIENKFSAKPENINLDINVLKGILKRKDIITPGLVEGSGQFQDSKARIIGEAFHMGAKEAYHLLNLYLAVESYVAINLVTGKRNINIIVQGGFAKNNIYLAALSALFPESKLLKATFSEATGLGAALCAKCALYGVKPHEISKNLLLIGEEVPKPPLDMDDLKEYLETFINEASFSR
jgi:sugar (pentulose or hexulose) kinase